ncbi:MAG: fibronectin type III domain-containing protein, partial [Actinomycetales bacterium]|nr:fibronectin type III domain-containing protein [Actinomycetales bacterium]
ASQEQSLVWVDPATGAQTRRMDGVGSSFSDLKVDSSTGLVYGRDEQGTVVVDLAAGRVLGMIMEPLDAVSGGRGYHATATGIDIIDLGSGLVPTRPPTVTAKVRRAVNSTVNAAISWQQPASAGSSPITGYRVQASAYRNAKDKKPMVVNYTVPAGTTSSRLTLKQVRTINAKAPAFYAFTVTPINAFGDGADGSTTVFATRK